MPVTRRRFLTGSTLAAAALPLADLVRAEVADAAQAAGPRGGVFRHGVASGDPRSDRVILWTRVSGATAEVPVRWVLARNQAFTQVVARGEAPTGAARDFTVKVDVTGLAPATTYYYRFDALGARSAVGRTRTLPAAGVARVRMALASCSNYPHGYFNVYGRIAERTDLDVVLHLGDYIYEYEQGRYADAALAADRAVDPAARDHWRSTTTAAATRTIAPTPTCRRRTASIRSSWCGTTTRSPTTPGAPAPRTTSRPTATSLPGATPPYQAFLEWLPVRDTGSARQPLIYRSFALGDLADLVMLDTRLAGRDQEVERTNVLGIEDPRRTILGAAQEQWLDGELRESVRAASRWQILGQQVMFAPQTPYNTTGGNPDSWDGYRASRSHVYDMVERHQVPNLVVLTGDVHSSWAYDLPRQLTDRLRPGVGSRLARRRDRVPGGVVAERPSRAGGRRAPGRDPGHPAAPQVPRRPLARLRRDRHHPRSAAGRLVVRRRR